ncbi:SGNH/GDSL hydrolase family protein [Pedobacter glucosidilyticus]|uniref:SGNH/GDSL hydrolase family protein n=1 Tax=Pedobacter glucosidilyticus TaxID=1122941 RepID=UPI00047EBD97|nr:SGNH/GDSL hydrolase family protein [Pedobacter glucosidilyticus]
MKCFTIILIWMLTPILYKGAYSQSKTDIEIQRAIAASQTGAAPLFFKVDKAYNKLELDTQSFDGEFIPRTGLSNFLFATKHQKTMTVGFIGGSITKADDGYRPQLLSYLQQLLPQNNFIGLNAGISGTGSDLGACRIKEQLLVHQPQIIFIDFAVNGAFVAGIEGIIRQIRNYNPSIDICLLYTISGEQYKVYASGRIPENIRKLEELADHYQVSSVHLGKSIGMLEALGKLEWKSQQKSSSKIIFSRDGIHPTYEGGKLYASVIARGIKKLMLDIPSSKKTYPLPNLLSTENWENAKMFHPHMIATFDQYWEKVNPLKELNLDSFAGWFPSVMKAYEPGATFRFKFRGTHFGIFDIGGPEVGQLEIIIDKHTPEAKYLRSNRFNVHCNNRYRGQYVLFPVKEGLHEVTIKISKEIPNKEEILGSNQLQDIKQFPNKYRQSVIYIGKILINGDVVK